MNLNKWYTKEPNNMTGRNSGSFCYYGYSFIVLIVLWFWLWVITKFWISWVVCVDNIITCSNRVSPQSAQISFGEFGNLKSAGAYCWTRYGTVEQIIIVCSANYYGTACIIVRPWWQVSANPMQAAGFSLEGLYKSRDPFTAIGPSLATTQSEAVVIVHNFTTLLFLLS